MTKYDSTARGGLLVSICRKLNIPFLFLGRGEGLDDLIPFDRDVYLSELINPDGE
jgi:fused signal recognition particle receptor